VNVTPRPVSNASWQSSPLSQSPGPVLSRTCLALAKAETPRAFHEFDFRLDHGPNRFKVGAVTEGPAPAFRPLPARSTLLRRPMTNCPVPGDWPRPSLDSAPRGALRPFLGHSAKMPRIRFYNRRFTSRAPMVKHHLSRPSAERRGKPADVRLRDRLLERGARSDAVSSGDAGPPCGHPASSGFALDGAMPASG
jgi:hypothetical protein